MVGFSAWIQSDTSPQEEQNALLQSFYKNWGKDSKFLSISQSHNKIISVCIPQGIFLKLLHKDVKW